jgi:dTDP-4-dehydrorhamnose reductase
MAALSRRHNVVGIDRHPWWGDRPANVLVGDLTTPGFVADTVATVVPDILIHCAGMVSVDACEQNPALAYACNMDITRRVARAVAPHCLVVYITTDGIFKGETPFATEEQLPCPRTVYGRSKLHGEWEVELATKNYLIIRTNFYGWSSGRKQTAAEWLYHALDTGQSIMLFDDFFFTPIYVVDFVVRLVLLIESGHRGIFHLCGKDRVSKGEFATLMAKAAGLSLENVRWGSIDDAHLAAPRPKDMSLSSERFRRITGVDVPGCMAGLLRFVADRQRPLSARFDGWEDRDHLEAAALKARGG